MTQSTTHSHAYGGDLHFVRSLRQSAGHKGGDIDDGARSVDTQIFLLLHIIDVIDEFLS